jgi:hypothetical protein
VFLLPPAPSLAVFKFPPVDQAPTGAPAPVHSSVAGDCEPGSIPPDAKAEGLPTPC